MLGKSLSDRALIELFRRVEPLRAGLQQLLTGASEQPFGAGVSLHKPIEIDVVQNNRIRRPLDQQMIASVHGAHFLFYLFALLFLRDDNPRFHKYGGEDNSPHRYNPDYQEKFISERGQRRKDFFLGT